MSIASVPRQWWAALELMRAAPFVLLRRPPGLVMLMGGLVFMRGGAQRGVERRRSSGV
jgi:hypothetical protein